MEVRLLGALEVAVDGRAVPLGSRRQRAVLAVLALHPNEVIPAARLIDEVWADDPPASVTNLVQGYVSHLRKALGTDAIATRGTGYQLVVDANAVDARRFERLANARADVDPAATADRLRAALALWRGPALADLADFDFARIEAARLEELRLDVLERRSAAELALGRHATAVAELEALVRRHPLRERLHALLMQALYGAGRQADALAAYRNARKTLVEELGIEPSADLRELEQAILAQDPSLAPPKRVAVRVPPPEFAHPVSPFVGRERELASLRSAWSAATSGSRRFVVVEGEAGIGKSALAAAFARDVRDGGAIVLFGRSDEQTVVPFQPLTEALRSLLAVVQPARKLGVLAHLLPELGGGEVATESEATRFRLFEAVAETFRGGAERAPLLLVLDDVQWADADTMLLLRHLLRGTTASRVLVLATLRQGESRPPLLTDVIAELRQADAYQRIVLTGLDEAEVAQLVAAVSEDDAAARVARSLRERTGGNPFFVVESLRHLGEGVPPDEIREAIAARIERIGAEAALTLAAVAGQEFEVGLLEAADLDNADELTDALEAALAAGLLVEPSDGDRLAFSHALVRETLYAQLSAARRRRLHARIGRALESRRARFAVEPAELALHFFEARGVVPATDVVRYAVEAAEDAVARLAFEDSAAQYARAVEAVGTADTTTRCDLLLSLGDALERAGDIGASRDRFREAAQLAHALELPDRLTKAALGFAKWQQFGTVDTDAIELLELALDYAGDDVDARACLLGLLAVRLDRTTEGERRESLLAEALELARSAAGETRSRVLGHVPYVLSQVDHAHERMAAASDAIELAAAEQRPAWALWARLSRFADLFALGDVDAADRDLAAYADLAEQTRDPWALWYAKMLLATRATFAGDLDRGRELAEEALRLRLRQDPDADEVYVVQDVMLARAAGRPADIDVERVAAFADRFAARAGCRALHAVVAAENGDVAPARAELARYAQSGVSVLWRAPDALNALALLAEAAFLADDDDAAADLYATLARFADRNVVMSGGWASWGSLSYQLGLLARTLGREHEADTHLAVAVAANETMGARPWATRARAGLREPTRSGDSRAAAPRRSRPRARR